MYLSEKRTPTNIVRICLFWIYLLIPRYCQPSKTIGENSIMSNERKLAVIMLWVFSIGFGNPNYFTFKDHSYTKFRNNTQ